MQLSVHVYLPNFYTFRITLRKVIYTCSAWAKRCRNYKYIQYCTYLYGWRSYCQRFILSLNYRFQFWGPEGKIIQIVIIWNLFQILERNKMSFECLYHKYSQNKLLMTNNTAQENLKYTRLWNVEIFSLNDCMRQGCLFGNYSS